MAQGGNFSGIYRKLQLKPLKSDNWNKDMRNTRKLATRATRARVYPYEVVYVFFFGLKGCLSLCGLGRILINDMIKMSISQPLRHVRLINANYSGSVFKITATFTQIQ
ncbi:hypothetical protein YC2023_107242 [Brassica napus]